jgi:hypothetical protein
MYATTREFLDRFGLNDLSDLPKVDEMSDVLGFELPNALTDAAATTSPLPFDGAPEEDRPAEPAGELPDPPAGGDDTVH